MPTKVAWRVCEGCGHEYDNPVALFDLYVHWARLIDSNAVIDPAESIDFCADCGEDFPDAEDEL